MDIVAATQLHPICSHDWMAIGSVNAYVDLFAINQTCAESVVWEVLKVTCPKGTLEFC